jgi:CheY-like chemotaxis protein
MILLVEDRPVSRQALAELLRSFGHDVLEAENTEQALELLENPIALVISS